MNADQKEAIDHHSQEIAEILKLTMKSFLNYLEGLRVISFQDKQTFTTEATPNYLLQLLKTKDDGWNAIIGYLNQTNSRNLAQKLQTSAGGTDSSIPPTAAKSDREDLLVTFRQKLVDYYLSCYSNVPTMFGCHKNVKDVWVPLRMEEKTRNPQQHDSFDHLELLKRLADCTTSKVALVKGHPGVGKTTLIRKIAYDWAINKANQFRWVLAVPLRSVGGTTDLLELAVDYYANKLQLLPGREEDLRQHLNQIGSDLLLCLDGLDEYESLARSPLRTLFAGAFKQSTATTTSKCPPPLLPYKLVVTSRPYACDLVNQEFFPLKFEISPLDKAHLEKFVQLFCETPDGVKKVSEYLKSNSKLVIQVPLILTFLCYLADVREEIPTNLTLLYERLLGHMVERDIDKLEVKIDKDTWKDSEVIKSTAQLGFEGCIDSRFEFPQSKQKNFGVTNDSFTCGFLLHIYNFRNESLSAEFPHRSVQEFFAALHFYQLCSTRDSTVEQMRGKAKEEMRNKSSQFGQFFFGICSNEKFEEIMDRVFLPDDSIKNKLEEIVLMSDFAETELLCRRLDSSLETFRHLIEAERNWQLSLPDLGWISPYSDIHCCSDLIMTKRCRLLLYFIDFRKSMHDLLSKTNKFDQIDIFVLQGLSDFDFHGVVSRLSVLPPISTFVWQSDLGAGLEANFVVKYETTTTTTKLRHVTFGYSNRHRVDLRQLPRPTPDDLVMEKSHKTGRNAEIAWVTVTVKTSLDQGHLLKFLARLADDIFQSDSERAEVSSDGVTDHSSEGSSTENLRSLSAPERCLPADLRPQLASQQSLWYSALEGHQVGFISASAGVAPAASELLITDRMTLKGLSMPQSQAQSLPDWNQLECGHSSFDSYQRQESLRQPSQFFSDAVGLVSRMPKSGTANMTLPAGLSYSPCGSFAIRVGTFWFWVLAGWQRPIRFSPCAVPTPIMPQLMFGLATFRPEHRTPHGHQHFNRISGEKPVDMIWLPYADQHTAETPDSAKMNQNHCASDLDTAEVD